VIFFTWVPSSPGPDLVNDKPPFGLLQFIVSEVENALLELNSSNGLGSNGALPLILKNCASAFALPLCMLFNRSLATCIFPDRWKLLLVTPIFKSGRRNDISNYPITVSITVGYCQVIRIAGVQGHVLGSEGLSRGLSTWFCKR
jgi:hypothetical protein